eukprot:s709_g4.t1
MACIQQRVAVYKCLSPKRALHVFVGPPCEEMHGVLCSSVRCSFDMLPTPLTLYAVGTVSAQSQHSRRGDLTVKGGMIDPVIPSPSPPQTPSQTAGSIASRASTASKNTTITRQQQQQMWQG